MSLQFPFMTRDKDSASFFLNYFRETITWDWQFLFLSPLNNSRYAPRMMIRQVVCVALHCMHCMVQNKKKNPLFGMEISRKGQNDTLPKFTWPNSEIYLLLFSVLYGESCRVILLPDIFTNIMWHAFPDNSIPTCKWYYMWFPQSDCFVAGKSGMRKAGRLKFALSTQECNSIKPKYFVENPSLWENALVQGREPQELCFIDARKWCREPPVDVIPKFI